MDSSMLQQQHFKLPFHLLFGRLSLVKTTPLIKYKIKTLTFKDNFNFQIAWLCGKILGTASVLYIERTVYFLFCCKDQMNVSFRPVNWITLTLAISLCQAIRLIPTRCLLKDINGVDCNIDATVALFFLTISYSVGKIDLKAESPNQTSSQNYHLQVWICQVSKSLI
jgi:hypothetical protein